MRDTKQGIIHFWFEETAPAQWFQKNDEFDALIAGRFASTYRMVADGVCDLWQDEPEGCLALCIVLDQFPRNMFRGSAEAFATDAKALRVARHVLARGFDQVIAPERRRFLYLPFEHSENIVDQDRSVTLFGALRDSDPVAYDYALRHRDVIVRFGRFPHRNAILGRQNTPEENEYLAQPGAGF